MSYLNEAFKRLAALDEDAFDITTEDGVENLDDFIDKDSFIDKIEIIDPDAQDEDEIKDSYVGKVILDCCVCHSKIYKDKEDVHIDEEVELANVDEECPFCFTTGDGFKIVGEIAPFSEEEDEEEIKDKEEIEVEDKLEEADKQAALSIEDAQKWVDYDMKRYHKISDRTNRLVKKAGFQIIKDDHGDYEVTAGKYESKNESLNKKKLTEGSLSEDQVDDFLDPYYKHVLELFEKTGDPEEAARQVVETLPVSERLQVATQVDVFDREKIREIVEKPLIKMLAKGSLQKKIDKLREQAVEIDNSNPDKAIQLQFEANQLKQKFSGLLNQNTVEEVNEAIEELSVSTDDSKMTMTSEEDGKITVTTEPKEDCCDKDDEVIVPVDQETEDEISIDVDDFDEDSFNELGESYFKNVYDNVSSFKTSSVSDKDGKVVVEGVIKFNSGKSKKTNFVFEANKSKVKGKTVLLGENAQITPNKKAFTLKGAVKDKKFVCESLNYKYNTKDIDGAFRRIYGTTKRGISK